MYSISFDIFTKALLVNAIDKERKIWEEKIVEGEMEQGTLLMHEQLLQLQRATLYAKEKVESEDPTQEKKDNWLSVRTFSLNELLVDRLDGTIRGIDN